MRAKKATKSTKPAKTTGSIRYLLSADRKLRKLSLRKMTGRPKNGKQPPPSIESKHSAHAKPSPPESWEMRGPAIVVGVICVVVAAALISAPQPSLRRDVGADEVTRAGSAPLTGGAVADRAEVRKTVASKPAAPAVSDTPSADASMAKPRASESEKASMAVESGVKTPAVESAGNAAAVEQAQKAAVQNVAPVTIAGCLQRDGGTFWLKDASGAEAPKSRTWKTGFLKKRPSRIEVLDAGHTLTLSSHVGRRVAATGLLMDREIWARSLRQIAASCN